MGHLTANTPKPLLQCGDRPFLAWILRELNRFGIEEVVLLAGYKSERVDSFCREASAYLPRPLSIRVSVEPSPAGTGGAVWHARHLLNDTFLLINGDSWIDTNLARFFAASINKQGMVGSVLLRKMEECTRYGTVDLDGNHITAFREKASVCGPGHISSGIYIFDQNLFEFLKPNCSLEINVLPVLAEKGLLLGHTLDGYFIDIGIPSDYSRAGDELPQRLMRPAVFFSGEGVLNKEGGSIGDEDRLIWNAGAKDALGLVTDAGFHAFVTANPSGIAHTPDIEAEELLIRMRDNVLQAGGTIDDIRVSPSRQIATGDDSKCVRNPWDPARDMILDLMAKWDVRNSRSIFVGYKEAGCKAAIAAGIEGYVYSGGSLSAFIEPLIEKLRSNASNTR